LNKKLALSLLAKEWLLSESMYSSLKMNTQQFGFSQN